MKNCTDCKWATWQETKTGKLHPSGDGRCSYPYKIPPLPASMYFINKPSQSGGFINRRKELTEHCTYFARKES